MIIDVLLDHWSGHVTTIKRARPNNHYALARHNLPYLNAMKKKIVFQCDMNNNRYVCCLYTSLSSQTCVDCNLEPCIGKLPTIHTHLTLVVPMYMRSHRIDALYSWLLTTKLNTGSLTSTRDNMPEQVHMRAISNDIQ